MAQELSEATLIEIDDMLDDISSHRDVSGESVTRAVKVLLAEVRRLRDEQFSEEPIPDERLLVNQPLANQPPQRQTGAVCLDDSTHPTRPPF